MNTPTLETERLILRKFTENDLEALYRIYSDEEANRFLPWFPLKNMEEARLLFREKYASKYLLPQAYAYAVCLKEDDIPVGYIKVDATEAAKAVIEQVKKDGLSYITATHDRDNPRSGGVMRNAGMKYRYSYEEQWQPKNIPVIFRMYQLNFDGDEERVYQKYRDISAVHFVETDL